MIMSNRLTYIIATGLLIFVFIITLFSIRDDSLTSDELVHLPAGYSYLTQKDMRLNPEHPPLLKNLSAIPLLFIRDIKFPFEIDAWQKNVNDQWEFGSYFLYRMGNPVEKMIFWARIPMILILILLGLYVFKWAREVFGNRAGLLALFLFSFSPTFLAHGRLVTTDVGSAAGVFIATYYFIKFLKDSSRKNLIIAGIVLGLAQLTKFSVVLILPFFGILIIIWAIRKSSGFREFLKTFGRYFGSCLLIGLIALSLIWVVYQYYTWNYPSGKQASDTESILAPSANEFLSNSTIWMTDKPVLRPIAHYLLGLIMAFQRTSGGDTTYFLGEVSGAGWKSYFPIVYLIKEPLTFHILTIISILYLIWLIYKSFRKNPIKTVLKNWVKYHFVELSCLIFIAIYWTTSLIINLNIGVRHLLPVFPFTILLVSAATISWLTPHHKRWGVKLKWTIFGILILWQAISIISIYPHFLAYANEIVGGPDNLYNYVVDSNLDWGQDLKRLSQWANEKGIAKIYLDYSGGYDKRYYSAEKYYLKEKFFPWWGTRSAEELPKGSYLAISAFFLQRGRGKPAPGFDQPTGYYHWLDKYQPVKKIGYSIFVYYIE
jgi:4-amino-4-deoxy-L-arabinose transferase-like glycosyltransferase